MNIYILGAGISGLSTAYLLKKRLESSGKDFNMVILEAENHPGGCIYSKRIDEYLVEWGPNGFLNNEPATFDLIKDLGIESRLLRSNDCARKRYIYMPPMLHKLPESPPEFLKSGILSFRGKLRFLMEPFIPQKKNEWEESVGEFVKRRFGQEPVLKMFDPFVSGVFAGDVSRLSIRNAIKAFYEMETEHGSVIRGMIKRIRARKKQKTDDKAEQFTGSKNPMKSILYSFDDGMYVFIDSLSRYLEDQLFCGCTVESVSIQEDGRFALDYKIDREPGSRENIDILISAIPAVCGSIFGKIGAPIQKVMEQIPAAPIAVVVLGYKDRDVPDPLDGFGYLIPRSEKIRTLGTLFSSRIFSNRAANGDVLLTTMIGGATDPQALDLPDHELLKIVRRNLKDILGIQQEPEFSHIIRHEIGIPQYVLGHNARVEEIQGFASRYPGLFFTGNSFGGISTNDCIRNSYRVVDEVMKLVDEKPFPEKIVL